jgi:hypothetical protein
MVIKKEVVFITGFVIALALLQKKIDKNEEHMNAAGKRKRGGKSFSSKQEVRSLQRKFPYNSKNKNKPWWRCGCSGGGIGGCVKGACIGPGTITINF